MRHPHRVQSLLTVVALGLILSACAPVAPSVSPPAQTVPSPAVTVTPTVAPTPTTAPESVPDAAVDPSVDWTTVATIEGDYYILGNPAAPIRLIDYGDFL